jgi:glucose/arabinose dehydrogenase
MLRRRARRLPARRWGRRSRLTLALIAAVFLLPVTAVQALTFEPIAPAGTYLDPMSIVSDPGNPDRLFVAERNGLIKLTQAGTTTTVVNLDDDVNSENPQAFGQQGIQSIAVPPDFDQSGLLYVFYTGYDGAPVAGNLHIGVLHVSGDTADPAALQEVITVPHGDGTGHNGGQILFGPDGYLYMSTGDGKNPGDPLENGQNLGTRLGKILRIKPDSSGGAGYSVPSDNPFAATPGCADGCDEIWSYGLRNPWRFTFDHETGAMLIGDVGQNTWEEVDYEPQSAGGGKGDNFGWDCREGMDAFTETSTSGSNADCPAKLAAGVFTDPVFQYAHGEPVEGCGDGSITGGYVVRDTGLGEELFGRYLYADFCMSELHSLTPVLPFASDDRSEGVTLDNPLSFGEDSACRLYVIEFDDDIYRLQGDAPSGCPPPPPGSGAAAITKSATTLKLKTARHRVERGDRVRLTATARPCSGRRGDRVTLFRGGAKLVGRKLSDSCKARFRPRIRRNWKFKAKIGSDAEHSGDSSNRVTVKLLQP